MKNLRLLFLQLVIQKLGHNINEIFKAKHPMKNLRLLFPQFVIQKLRYNINV